MSFNDTLIILNTTKVGDSSIVIHTLSKSLGRRSFLVTAGKGLPMSMFLPLNVVEADIVENPKSQLWRARNFSAVSPLNGIRDNIRKNTMTLFLGEVLFKVLKEGACEEGLFDWCRKSIFTLDALEDDFANFHILFLLGLCSALGFATSPEGIMPFAQEHYKSLSALIRKPFNEAMLVPLTGEDRNEIADILLQYLSYHTESAINIRSLRVLRELFA